MPSAPKKFTYAVMREDNTSVLYEWTKNEFSLVCQSLNADCKFARFADGIISLVGIRAIVLQKEEPKPKEKSKPLESGMPEVDAVSLAWLKEQEKQIEEWNDRFGLKDEDSELDGGRFS